MEEVPVPGAFPTEEVASPRVPKKKFIGRRTAEARAREQQEAGGVVEETTTLVQRGENSVQSSRPEDADLQQHPVEHLML
jgi:predicted transcriptional regulator